jgi:hypothetical protein
MKTNLKLMKNTQSSVIYDGNYVLIESLAIQNPDLNEYMKDKEDPVSAFIGLVESALNMRKISNSSAEAEKLGAVAERLSVAFENASQEATQEFGKLIKLHTDETNPVALASMLKSKILKSVTEELKPSNDSSPFHDIAETLTQLLAEVTKQAGAKPALDNSNAKGTSFNLVMDGILQEIASKNGDSALFTNDVASETGSKEGDEVITISQDQTGGAEVNVVWEFKAEKGISQAAALKEISSAMQNRHAVAGVFVVAREPKNAHWSLPIYATGNRLILVVDKDNPDLSLIQFGYIWSRWVAFRSLETKSVTIDLERIEFLISEASLSLKDFAQLKKSHTGIQSSLDDATNWTKTVESKLKSKFKEISEAMKGDN